MFRCTNATTERCAQDHRAAEPAAGTIAQAAGVIDHLVDAGVNESHKLDFSNRAHTLCRQPDTHAGYGGFSKWGVQYALLTKALQESIGGPEHAAINAYILAQHQYLIIFIHCPAQGQVHRFQQGDFSHGFNPLPGWLAVARCIAGPVRREVQRRDTQIWRWFVVVGWRGSRPRPSQSAACSRQ